MRRREFIAGLGSAAAWPLAARAQQAERVRRIGLLNGTNENDPMQKTYFSAFTQALADLGWTDGRKVRTELRWGGVDINRIRALAQELVGLQPAIILANSTPVTTALQRETRTIPIVMATVSDPVGSGLVAGLNRPGGNITGFAILRGAKPADLPVQLPTKFEMIVNLKTAKALGLTVPPSIMLRADEVIE